MKRKLTKRIVKFLIILAVIVTCNNAFALDAPVLTASTSGLEVSLTWTSVSGTTNYTLYYAPYPYMGEHTIGNIDMKTATNLSATLWDDAAYYVTVTASDGSVLGESGYSNVKLLDLTSPGPGEYDFVDYFMALPTGSYVVEQVQQSTGGTYYNKDVTGRSKFNGYETISLKYYVSHDGGNSFKYGDTTHHSYDTNNIYLHGIEESPDDYLTCDPPTAYKRFMNIGDTYKVTHNITYSDGSSETVVETIEFLKVENITVPAGNFKDCLKVRFIEPDETSTTWFAKGVGEIKKTKKKLTHTNEYKMTEYYIAPTD